MNAFLLGATGLVGSHLLQQLLASDRYQHVVAPVRRSTGIDDERLIEVPFDASNVDTWTPPVDLDHAFVAFGTTRKAAGGINNQRLIDLEMPRHYARRLRALGVRHISLCSALGADHESSNAYSAMKGQLEEDIRMMGFPSFATFRPSVLGGHRPGSPRPTEAWAQRAMAWLPRSLRTIPAERVAAAMLRVAGEEPAGMTIVRNAQIFDLSSHA
ncbi:MAG: NAD(P)H-binding protein [Bacteroidetes bacterium]|nr:NAD(P)H-binding protein [Bacteroidota bacterium]MDA0874472.1 NAD(P)H-binding protein [Bacteroidota bacterium]